MVRKLSKLLVYIIGAIVVLAAGLAFFLPTLSSFEFAVVYSGSMEPVMPVGALALMEPVEPSEIEVGDIIAFNPIFDPNTTVSHRVVEVLDDGPSLVFRTKGDANEDPDVLGVPAGRVLARVSFNIPNVGYAFVSMREYIGNRLGFVLAVCLPTFLLIGIAARDMNFMFSPGKRGARQRKRMMERRNKRRFHS